MFGPTGSRRSRFSSTFSACEIKRGWPGGCFMWIYGVIIGFFSILGRFLCAGRLFFVDVCNEPVIGAGTYSVFTPFGKRGKIEERNLTNRRFRRKQHGH